MCSSPYDDRRECSAHRQFNFCGVSLHLQLLKRQGRSLQNFVQHFCSQKKRNPIWLTLKMSLWRHHSKSLSACGKLSRSLCTFSPLCVRLLLHFHQTLWHFRTVEVGQKHREPKQRAVSVWPAHTEICFQELLRWILLGWELETVCFVLADS